MSGDVGNHIFDNILSCFRFVFVVIVNVVCLYSLHKYIHMYIYMFVYTVYLSKYED